MTTTTSPSLAAILVESASIVKLDETASAPKHASNAAYSLRTNSMAFDLPIALLAPTILDELCASRCEVCSSAVWKRAALVPRDAPKTSGVM